MVRGNTGDEGEYVVMGDKGGLIGEVGKALYSWLIVNRRTAVACRISVLFGKSFPLRRSSISCKNPKLVSTLTKLKD